MSGQPARTLPHNIDFEQRVIAAMMLRPEACEQALELLEPKHFYKANHQKIFQACTELSQKKIPVELPTLAQELSGKVKAHYLSKIIDEVPQATNIKHFADEIINKSSLRRIISITDDVQKACYGANGDTPEVINRAKEEIKHIQPRGVAQGLKSAILEADDFDKIELPAKEIYLYPWLTEHSIGLISGWRGTGKSWFAMSILDAITNGLQFGPWYGVNHSPCLYFEAEMPAYDIQDRLSLIKNKPERKNPLYVYSDAYANFLGLPKADLTSEKWREGMKDILLQKNVKLWALDNLSSVTAGLDENSKQDWSPINNWLLELRFAGVSTILLHHTNKDGKQRGTSAREDNLDFSITLRRPNNYQAEDGASFNVVFEKARVGTEDLSLIAETHFRLDQDPEGKLVWTCGNVKKEMKKEILKMIDEGYKNQEIAETLGVTKGRVSQVKTAAIKAGDMTTSGKLKQSAYLEICGE